MPPFNQPPPLKPPVPAWKTWAMIAGAVAVGSIGLIVVGSALPKPKPPPPAEEAPPPPRRSLSRPPLATSTAEPDPAADRPTGVFRTKKGYLGARTRAKLEQVLDLAARDVPALDVLLRTDPTVFAIQEGLEVEIVDADGVLSGVAQVRKKGATSTFWTVREALE
jgi:hypothetical protein